MGLPIYDTPFITISSGPTLYAVHVRPVRFRCKDLAMGFSRACRAYQLPDMDPLPKKSLKTW